MITEHNGVRIISGKQYDFLQKALLVVSTCLLTTHLGAPENILKPVPSGNIAQHS